MARPRGRYGLADRLVAHRTGPRTEARRGEEGLADEFARPGDGLLERQALAEQRSDRARQRAAGAVGVARVDAWRTPDPVARARLNEHVDDFGPFGIAAFCEIGDVPLRHAASSAEGVQLEHIGRCYRGER